MAGITVSLDALGGADHAGVPKSSFGVCVDLRLEEFVIEVPGEAERLRDGRGLSPDSLLQVFGYPFTGGLDVIIEHPCVRGELERGCGVKNFLGKVGLSNFILYPASVGKHSSTDRLWF